MQTFKLSFSVFVLVVALTGCEKNSIESADTVPYENESGSPRVNAASCTNFNYSASIFYLREQLKDYVVSPVKALAGTYGASPEGLQINTSTGAINVSKSETGLKYKVFFVRSGTKDTCSQYVTISGIDYLSSVHVLSRNDTLIKPLYNAVPDLGMPCTNGGDDDDDSNIAVNSCEFDDDDDDDDKDGNGDEPSAGQQLRLQGVAINRSNAVINLKRTVRNGTFGINPVNGTARIFRLYYKINDASKKTLNHIDVKLIYYDKLSNVPSSLITKIKTQNARLAAPPATAPGTALPVGYATVAKGGRPPDIVVTGRAE